MAAAGFGWTRLSPSRDRRRLLLAATFISATLAVTLLGSALAAPTHARWAAVAVVIVAVAAAGWGAVRPEPAWALRIDPEGRIWQRSAADSAVREDLLDSGPLPVRLWPTMAGTRLLGFSGASGFRLVWRDSLPPDRFRRLAAHARWHVERDAGAAERRTAAEDA